MLYIQICGSEAILDDMGSGGFWTLILYIYIYSRVHLSNINLLHQYGLLNTIFNRRDPDNFYLLWMDGWMEGWMDGWWMESFIFFFLDI